MAGNQQQIDFGRLASDLLGQGQSLLYDWLPGGKVVGNEFECGNLSGVPGRSLRINLKTGKWKDFATDVAGGDLIALYAAIHRISQVEAAKQLGGQPQPSMANGNGHAHHHPADADRPSLVPPPKGTKRPSFQHKHGKPTAVWAYRDGSDSILYFIARYDTADGKQFIPFSYRSDGKWVNKAWPEPRPLYGLELLALHQDRAVLIVEGEKACDAARQIAGHVYCVVTWQGGASALKKTDLTPIHGRKILLWPDADKPGVEAMYKLASFLVEHCPEVKLINPAPEADGWDAADALAASWDWKRFRQWASDRAHKYAPMHQQVVAPPQTEIIEPNKAEVLPASSEPTPSHPTLNVSVTNSNDPAEAPVSLHAAWENMGLAMTKNSGPVASLDNAVRILERWEPLAGVLWFDEFHRRILTNKGPSKTVREWLDVDDIDLTVYFQRVLGLQKMTERIVRSAVELFAFRNKRNEPRDWMASLRWDSNPRIESFFVKAFGCEANEYTAAVSRNWWVAMAARVFSPGCKFDNMVVLEGFQGKLKSTALNLIGGPWFMEAGETFGTKDFLQTLNGKLLVEIAELDSFSKADVKTIKKTISCRVDTYRASYGRRSQDFPRGCVFVGSTNEDEYLDDPTGGRRFWPLRTNDVDLDYIKANRDQLFAEAAYRYKQGATWWEVPDTARKEQESRRRVDAWEETLVHWLTGRDKLRLSDIAQGAFSIDQADFDKRSQMRLGAVLRALGWERRTEWTAGRSEKLWVRGEHAAVGGGKGQGSIFEQQKRVHNYAPGADNSEVEA